MFLLATVEMPANPSHVSRSFWVTHLKIETLQILDRRNLFRTEAEEDTPKLKRIKKALMMLTSSKCLEKTSTSS
jgi:hypothetical protein